MCIFPFTHIDIITKEMPSIQNLTVKFYKMFIRHIFKFTSVNVFLFLRLISKTV